MMIIFSAELISPFLWRISMWSGVRCFTRWATNALYDKKAQILLLAKM